LGNERTQKEAYGKIVVLVDQIHRKGPSTNRGGRKKKHPV